MRARGVFSLLCLAVWFAVGCIDRQEEGKDALTVAASLLGLTPQVEVKEAAMFEDGGTIGFVLVDASGVELPCCLDGRLRAEEHDGPYHFFRNAQHPSHGGAVRLPVGGVEEQALVMLLENWSARNPAPDRLPPHPPLPKGPLSREEALAWKAEVQALQAPYWIGRLLRKLSFSGRR